MTTDEGGFGLPAAALTKIRQVLASHPAIEAAVIYGSRAKGNFRPGSDIDLTLLGDTLVDHDLRRVIRDLDDLLLPYAFDLSLYRQLDHPGLLAHINRAGQTLYRKEEAPC
ncbi:MAG: nucleotidyltransferase domain-containing protein [Desulfobacteraceae bacterium]|nr:nucleotidyltransferase domain-containing protein [Desulfobacteraceae bacterium]